MIVLGIDPGYGRCGYGLINQDGNQSRLIEYGCFETPAEWDLVERFAYLNQELGMLVQKHKPEKTGVEQLFFSKNTKTALDVAQARGVIMLCLHQQQIKPVELTPNQIKQAITGQGNADKKQVQQMIRLILALDHDPKPDDAADALAVALAAATWNDKIRI